MREVKNLMDAFKNLMESITDVSKHYTNCLGKLADEFVAELKGKESDKDENKDSKKPEEQKKEETKPEEEKKEQEQKPEEKK